jgi:hypothetical protein
LRSSTNARVLSSVTSISQARVEEVAVAKPTRRP